MQSYKCDKCNFKSEDRNKIEEHMTNSHSEIEKEYYVESGAIARPLEKANKQFTATFSILKAIWKLN